MKSQSRAGTVAHLLLTFAATFLLCSCSYYEKYVQPRLPDSVADTLNTLLPDSLPAIDTLLPHPDSLHSDTLVASHPDSLLTWALTGKRWNKINATYPNSFAFSPEWGSEFTYEGVEIAIAPARKNLEQDGSWMGSTWWVEDSTLHVYYPFRSSLNLDEYLIVSVTDSALQLRYWTNYELDEPQTLFDEIYEYVSEPLF